MNKNEKILSLSPEFLCWNEIESQEANGEATFTTEACSVTGDRKQRLYIKLHSSEALPKISRIKKAYLEIVQQSCELESTNGEYLALRQVNNYVSESNGIKTFSENTEILSFCAVETEADTKYRFDITDCIEKAVSYPLMFEVSAEGMQTDKAIALDCSSVSSASIIYQYTTAMQDTDFSESIELCRGFNAFVDRKYGNLMLSAPLFEDGSAGLPTNLRLLYNSDMSDTVFTPGSSFEEIVNFVFNTGCGFKPELLCCVKQSGENIMFTDENANVTTLCPTENEDVYKESENEEMMYTVSTRTLKNGDDTYTFTEDGKILSRSDKFANSVSYTYDAEGRLYSVTDTSGDSFVMGYTALNQLCTITKSEAEQVTLAYENENLTAITYPDGSKTLLSYSEGKCTAILSQNAQGGSVRKAEFTFNGNRVVEIKVYGFEGLEPVLISRKVLEFRPSLSQSTVTEYSEDATLKTIYVINDEEETYEYTLYQNDDGAFVPLDTPPHNLISHYTFENESWLPYHTDETEVSFPKNESLALFGESFARISVAESGTKGLRSVVREFPAGKYCFSAFVKVIDEFTDATSAGVSVRVSKTSGNIVSKSEVYNCAGGDYTRLYTAFEISEPTELRFHVITDGVGTAYADGLMLTADELPCALNLVSNSDFANGLTGWNGQAEIVTVAFSGTSSIKLTSAPFMDCNIWQSVPFKKGKSIRESFTLSGYAKAENAVADGSFCLKARIEYVGGESEEFTAEFLHDTDVWQKAEVTFSKSQYLEVSDVKVICDYSSNIGTALFDGILLTQNGCEYELNASDFEQEENSAEQTAFVESKMPEESDFEEALNAKGLPLTDTAFSDDAFGAIYKSNAYDEDGNLIRETDARGFNTEYEIDEVTKKPEKITDREGAQTEYTYDTLGRVTSVLSGGSQLGYTYNSFDNISEISRADGMKYTLAYTPSGELKSIGINGKSESLAEYSYKQGSGNLKSVTYANGNTMKATYNAKGQLISEKWYSEKECQNLTAHYKYVYDADGNVARSIDLISKREYNYVYTDGVLESAYEYTITLSGELITAKTLVCSISYVYDSEGTLKCKKISHSATSVKTTVKYLENENQVTVGDMKYISRSKTDRLSRKLYDELVLPQTALYRKFGYHEGAITAEHKENGKVVGAPTTSLVSSIEYSGGRVLEYEYDKEERITKVTELENGSVVSVTEYTYDSLGQLLTEVVNGATVNTLTYDGYGNITSKNGASYTYGNNVWKDLLTAVGDNTITYDAEGNPTSYLGHTLSWEKGRTLKSYDGISFEYNESGIRTVKQTASTKHTYTLDGTKILREYFGGRSIIPMYDSEDNVCGIVYNGESYFFVKNLQGDVTHITNADGEVVAKYSYDAFGKPTTVFDNSGKSIAHYNPFRYRSYYYDTETGLYYLQSRYYDANTGRFVNADAPEFATNQYTSAKQNLFTYCENAPIELLDPTGFWPNKFKTITSADINCYAYVLGLKSKRLITGFGRTTTVEKLYDKVCKDLKSLKLSYIKLGSNRYSKTVSNKYYLIAMRVGHGTTPYGWNDDYHFWVRHENYIWSHKPGICISEQLGWDRYLNPSKAKWNMYLDVKKHKGGYVPVRQIVNFYNSKTYYLAIKKS